MKGHTDRSSILNFSHIKEKYLQNFKLNFYKGLYGTYRFYSLLVTYSRCRYSQKKEKKGPSFYVFNLVVPRTLEENSLDM